MQLNDHDNDGEEEGENNDRGGVVVQLQTRKSCDGALDDDDDDTPEEIISASNTRSVDRFWLGQEPNLLDVATEEQGVADILAALSSEEREQVQREDTSMPIRHFRAEKVSGWRYQVIRSPPLLKFLETSIAGLGDSFSSHLLCCDI